MKSKTLATINETDNSAVTRGDQLRKTETTLAREINLAYEEFTQSTSEILDLALSIENRRVKLGALLDAAKRQLGHGKFSTFLQSHVPFSERTGQRFMKFAAAANFTELKNLDELKAYHALLIDWGLKPEPVGHGPQSLHDQPNYFVQATKGLGNVRRTLHDLLENRPITEWDDSEKSQLREQLLPVVEIFNQL